MKDEDAAKPRGRPPAEQPHSPITVWVSTQEHDRLIELAVRQRKSLSATVRELLAKTR